VGHFDCGRVIQGTGALTVAVRKGALPNRDRKGAGASKIFWPTTTGEQMM
jgi:hypothetical protein